MADKPTTGEMAQAEKVLGAGAKAAPAPAAAAHAPAAAPAAAPKKKKAKKAAGPSMGERVKSLAVEVRTQAVEILKGLRSPDGPTRRMSVLFFLSLLSVIALGVVMALPSRQTPDMGHDAGHSEEHAAEGHGADAAHGDKPDAHGGGHGDSHAASGHGDAHGGGHGSKSHSSKNLTMMELGAFTIELKPVPGAEPHAFMNMAEVEIVIECDSGATHTFVEENLVQVRNQVTSVFLSMDRQTLLSRDGKRKLKKQVLDKINGWLPKGKVNNVFFSKLVVA